MNRAVTRTDSPIIPAGEVALAADVLHAAEPRGLVISVHGSGSSRMSPRNRRVAAVLNEHGFTTVLCDLLTPDEEFVDERTAELRFDIPALSARTVHVIDWVRSHGAVSALPIGLFGASTGAAAAIVAATLRAYEVGAVVSRGGRIDLAGPALQQLAAPLLMIVGSTDVPLIALHGRAMPHLTCEHRYEVVAGAGHLFEEPGALSVVARLARTWFEQHASLKRAHA